MTDPKYREKLDRWVDEHEEEMVADIAKLVAIDSTKGKAEKGKPFGEGPAAAVALMEKLMQDYGLKTRNYENYCIAGDLPGSGDKALDILAHLDVVPVSNDWTVTKPFVMKREGDRIYGRGTSDDKGPAVAALYALRAIKELGLPLERGVRLLCGSDEETGSSDLAYYYGIEKEADYTFSPDADYPLINIEKARLSKSFTAQTDAGTCLLSIHAGDKSNVIPGKAYACIRGISDDVLMDTAVRSEALTGASFKVEDAGMTDCRKISVRGKTGHAASPEGGVNALTALLSFIDLLAIDDGEGSRMIRHLAQMFPFGDHHGTAAGVDMEDEESGRLTLSLTVLDYEDGVLKGTFDARAPLCAADENLTAKLSKRFAGAGMKMEEGGMIPAHCVSADSHLVQILLASYELYFGKKGEPIAIGGGTYVHELERGVAFGCALPEVDNRMHGDDEFAEVSVLVKSVKIFADAILRLCGA